MQAKSPLRWSARLLLVAGFSALGYSGYVLLDARLYQDREARSFERTLNAFAARGRARAGQLALAAAEGSPLGRIEIPRLGLSAMILEGADALTLRRGVGHIPGTALPAQPGNVGIAGHRDTFFRPLREIRKGDEIVLTTLDGLRRYSVESTEVVRPDDVRVLSPSSQPMLTLVTCYPFYFVGSAPWRFVVHARGDSEAQNRFER